MCRVVGLVLELSLVPQRIEVLRVGSLGARCWSSEFEKRLLVEDIFGFRLPLISGRTGPF